MTNETNRMKTKVGRIGSRGIAIVLCFVMLLTAIGSGSVLSAIAVEGNGASVLLDAAKAGASVDVAADVAAADDKAAADEDEAPLTKKADSDLADTGRDADVASTGQTGYLRGIKGKGYPIRFLCDGTSWSTTATTNLLTNDDNNHYYGSFIMTGDSDNSLGFKIYATGTDGGYYANGYGFHSGYDGGEMELSSTGQNMSLALGSDSSSKRFTVTVDLYCEYGSNNNSYLKVSFSQYETAQFYGGVTGSWALSDMTYDSKDCYRYDISGNGSRISFRLRWAGASETIYYYPGSNHTGYDIKDTNNYDSGYNMDSSTSSDNTSKYFYFDTVSGGSYSVFIKLGRVWITKSEPASEYYLTGWLNGAGYSGTAYKFTGSGDNYTYTFNSTTAAQYLTVTDSAGNTYHPGSHPAANGAAYTSTDSNPTADNKWGITSGAKGKSITFTWKPTSKTLSWTVAAGEMITVYAKDGAAPIDWDHKDQGGATDTSGTDYNFGVIATTAASSDGVTFTSVDCGKNGATSGSKYQTGAVEAGKNITINTTISSTYSSKYYVRGWNINGYTYKVGTNVKGVNTGTSDGTNGKYTMTYTIPATLTSSTKIEITPIYYLVNNANTITFYLEGFDEALQTTGGWGNTPYCYPFYGALSGYQNSFGAYPGQPMVFVDGKYSIEIPITSKAISSDTYDGTIIKGVTVNNGYADHVHRNLVYGWTTASGDTANDNTHMQTYDYDDFYKIYNEKRDSQGNKPNSIILRIKNETTYYNRDNYGDANNGVNWKFTTNNPASSLSNTEVTTIAGSTRNGWELLTDRYGRPVDLFGNVISTSYSADAEMAKPAIRVISTGYNENIAGDYGTAWLIYTPTGADGTTYNTAVTNGGYTGSSGYTLQTAASDRKAVPPSVFLLNSESSFNTSTYPAVSRTFDGASYTDTITNYKTLYNTLKTSGTAGTNALGRYVYITYEKNAQRYGANASSSATKTLYGAFRADARWYYTYATDMVSANIKVQVLNTDTNKYQDVAFKTNNSGYNKKNNNTVASTVSGRSTENLKAYFTNTAFDGEVESGDVLINSGDFEFTAKSASGWMFDSWQIEYDGGSTYTELSTDASASTAMSATDTLVARFKPINAGNLNLSHELSPSSTGAGTTELKVVVYTDDTKTSPIYDTGYTTDDVALDGEFISNEYADYYIDVTLRTTPAGDDKLTQMAGPRKEHFGGTSATRSYSNVNTQETYNFGFKVGTLYSETTQSYTSLAYTSTITRTDHTYKITYNYPKRGCSTNDGSYTVSGTFTSNEYAAYVDTTKSNRPVADAFIKSKAPYESNFNKTLSLSYSSKSCTYNTSTHAHTVTINYTSTDDVDTYVIFDLPYDYYTEAKSVDGVQVKKFTAKPNASGKILTTDDAETIEIDTVYGNYLTSAADCAQTNVKKVDDSGDPNHTGNDFITAPEEMYSADGNTKLYFNYWQIMTADRSLELNRVYYVDFNYRSYGNYYVKPVYTANANDCWRLRNKFENDFSASIMYLDTTRNQWNSSTSQSNVNNTTIAADRLYNDFLVAYGFNGEEIKNNSKVSEVGIIFEIVPTAKGGTEYALGDASSASTAVYKTQYDSTKPDESVLKNFVNGTTPSTGKYLKAVLNKNGSNTKNRIEYDHTFYAQYGQNGYDFLTDPKTDDYVFRAYSYIKDSTGKIAISTPVYFSMAYTANRKG